MAKQFGKYGSWKDKKVFVTGGTGFIGTWLVKALINAGAEVTCLALEIPADSNFVMLGLNKKVNLVYGNILDLNLLKIILHKYEIDTVFHLAAQPLVQVAYKNPIETFKTNIKGTWNLLEACRLNNIKRIIVASSDKAYGIHEKLPYDEKFALKGDFPYDVSKSCADLIAQSYSKTYGMLIGITRCANTYGGGDLNFSRIVPGTIKSVLFNEIPIIRSDGTPERDYIYIKDVVNAYLTLAENLDRKEVIGEAFNFGSGKSISVINLFKKIIKLCGKNVKPKILGKAKHEIDRQYLNIEKAKKILGWQPEYNIDKGLKKTIEWYKNYFKK